jgi:hypothetical protein
MKTALLISELPTTNMPDEDRGRWIDFSNKVKSIGEPPKNTNRLTGNVWQIPLDNGLPFLARLFDAAEASKISVRALILDEPPTWIENPQSIQSVV